MEQLHTWFLENRRSFPWRENRTPYRVWISEVMLQQTRAAVVVPYFLRWMETFPTLIDVARAPVEHVIKLWEGLGYYSRARHIHRGAQYIVNTYNGKIPCSKKLLLSIPGLGPYTAGAILSFGFSQRAVAIDSNVIRCITRFFAWRKNIALVETKRWIEQKVDSLLDVNEPWITTEALIELGALVCTQQPKCHECPLQNSCLGKKQHLTHTLPIKIKKPKAILLSRIVFVLDADGHFLLRQGMQGKVMADLYEFPYLTCTEPPLRKEVEEYLHEITNYAVHDLCALQCVSHTFTKYKALLYPFACTIAVPHAQLHPAMFFQKFGKNLSWVEKKQCAQLPFSSGHRRILHQLLSH